MIIRAQPTAGPRQARDCEWADTLGWVGGRGGPWPAVADCHLQADLRCGLAAGPSSPGVLRQSHVGAGEASKTVSLLSAQVSVSVCMSFMLKQIETAVFQPASQGSPFLALLF